MPKSLPLLCLFDQRIGAASHSKPESVAGSLSPFWLIEDATHLQHVDQLLIAYVLFIQALSGGWHEHKLYAKAEPVQSTSQK